MILSKNKLFDLPKFTAGSFRGLDRLEIPYNILMLREVLQREDNGNIELVCQAEDGPEEKRGEVHFLIDDRKKKDELFYWLQQQIGKNIETIYKSNFSFNGKICPKCGNEMFRSMEPKVGNLANVYSKLLKQVEYWRCVNNECDYIEK